MEINLAGKCTLITGGTRGIGRAISLAFARANSKVVINYNSDEKAASETKSLLESEGFSPLMIKGNASDFDFGKKLSSFCIEKMGKIDILINNAGISHNTPFLLLEPEEWKKAIDVNINALYSVTHPVLRHMVDKKIHGKILNLSSVCGVRPVAAVPVHYAATKAAIVGFTYTLAKEVGRYGIQVNAVAPGLIETEFSRNLPEARRGDFKKFCPLGRIGKPEEVADVVVFLASDFNSYMTGETVLISGGL
ncbi:MAG: 3-oxoacyl-ACP reductase FabG [Candidatus Riflebacteria bacterium]|nr:3-oxoacyl-ACP reductase FabG [Candidatus Riflebacteria bacterium]